MPTVLPRMIDLLNWSLEAKEEGGMEFKNVLSDVLLEYFKGTNRIDRRLENMAISASFLDFENRAFKFQKTIDLAEKVQDSLNLNIESRVKDFLDFLKDEGLFLAKGYLELIDIKTSETEDDTTVEDFDPEIAKRMRNANISGEVQGPEHESIKQEILKYENIDAQTVGKFFKRHKLEMGTAQFEHNKAYIFFEENQNQFPRPGFQTIVDEY